MSDLQKSNSSQIGLIQKWVAVPTCNVFSQIAAHVGRCGSVQSLPDCLFKMEAMALRRPLSLNKARVFVGCDTQTL